MNLFNSRETLQRVHQLPRHVIIWLEEHEDELVCIYDNLQAHEMPWIFDKADFCSFCACVARLSTIDSPRGPHGRVGGRLLVHDFMSPVRTAAADAEVASRFAHLLLEPTDEVEEFESATDEEEDDAQR